MRKFQEQKNPNSCWSRAKQKEMLFVLLSRDIAAPATIRFWIQERVRLGKNNAMDAQLVEAAKSADIMEMEVSDNG